MLKKIRLFANDVLDFMKTKDSDNKLVKGLKTFVVLWATAGIVFTAAKIALAVATPAIIAGAVGVAVVIAGLTVARKINVAKAAKASTPSATADDVAASNGPSAAADLSADFTAAKDAAATAAPAVKPAPDAPKP